MDIRGSLLDCEGIYHAKSTPPVPKPEIATQSVAPGPLEEPNEAVGDIPPEPSSPAEAMRRSSRALLANAFSAAKEVAKSRKIGMPGGKGPADEDASRNEDSAIQGSRAGTSGSGGGGLSTMRGILRRGSRSENNQTAGQPPHQLLSPNFLRRGSRTEKDPLTGKPQQPSSPTRSPPLSPKRSLRVPALSPRSARPSENEERERSDLFRGASRSPGKSPRGSATAASSASSRFSLAAKKVYDDTVTINSTPSESLPPPPISGDHVGPTPATTTPTLPSSPAKGREPNGRRAFARGLWSGNRGDSSVSRATAGKAGVSDTVLPFGETSTAAKIIAPPPGGTMPSAQNFDRKTQLPTNISPSVNLKSAAGPAATPTNAKKPTPGGGKRTFAGGSFSGPSAQVSSTTAAPSTLPSSNPFGGGDSLSTRDCVQGKAGSAPKVGLVRSLERLMSPKVAPTWTNERPGCDVRSPDRADHNDASTGRAKGSAGPNVPSGNGRSNGYGLAPSSRPAQGQEFVKKSPLLTVGALAPPASRPSQRRPGESGSRKPFGGGERIF